MARLLMLVVLLALGATVPACRAASFDCGRAVSPDERAVCADPVLSDLDDALARANEQARATTKRENAPSLLSAARGIIADRRACGAVRGWLLTAYINGLETYGTFGSRVAVPDWIDAREIAGGTAPERNVLPSRLGQCVTTRVASVTARLEGEPSGSFESGTAINFANGGFQVSYEREAALIASRPGDGAVMCLSFVPRDCPRGDDRGRVYRVTNLRTRASWALPDSQHSCGGA